MTNTEKEVKLYYVGYAACRWKEQVVGNITSTKDTEILMESEGRCMVSSRRGWIGCLMRSRVLRVQKRRVCSWCWPQQSWIQPNLLDCLRTVRVKEGTGRMRSGACVTLGAWKSLEIQKNFVVLIWGLGRGSYELVHRLLKEEDDVDLGEAPRKRVSSSSRAMSFQTTLFC